jgi:hypothetical protein
MIRRACGWCSLAIALVIWAPYAFAHRDRIERPTSISEEPASLTISFAEGSRVVLHRDAEGSVRAVTIYVGTLPYRVPEDVCAKLPKVHVETVRLLWDGNVPTPQTSTYFYVRFSAGSEEERSLGDLPEISLIFRDGLHSDAWIKRKINENTWQTSDLKEGHSLFFEQRFSK